MWLDRLINSPSLESRERLGQRAPSQRQNRWGQPLGNDSLTGSTLDERSPLSYAVTVEDPNKTSFPVSREISIAKIKDELRAGSEDGVSNAPDILSAILGQQPTQTNIRSNKLQNAYELLADQQQNVENTALVAAKPASNSENVKELDWYSETKQCLEVEHTRYQDLHQSIMACDDVLKSVELYLNSFRSELSAVSSEIEDLQDRSATMNQRLENRRGVQIMLCPAVESLVVIPAAVKKLVQGNFDEFWIKSLQDVQKRQMAIDQKPTGKAEDQNLGKVSLFMTQLSDKLVERVRDYVVSQIKALRHPNIDAQIVQQRNFLPYQPGFAYLANHQPQLAGDISNAYVATMAWYYASHLARYKISVGKLAIRKMDYTDALVDDSNFRKNSKLTGMQEVFSIGRRADMLKSSEINPVPAFAADEDRSTHFLETPFCSYNVAFIENAISEYIFLSKFFSDQSVATLNSQFRNIFKTASNQGYGFTKQLIESTTDAIGVLICIRLTQKCAFKLQQQKVPALDDYINGTNMLLWPKFQNIVDAHCAAIRKATITLAGKPTGTALTLTASASAIPGTAPHSLTQRLGILLHSILSLSIEGGDDEPVAASLRRLLGEYDTFLLKLSRGLAEPRRRDRLLYNNYSLIRTILTDVNGRLAQEAESHFEGRCNALHHEE